MKYLLVSSILSSFEINCFLQWTIQVAANDAVTGTSITQGNRAILGIAISDSTIAGITNDGTLWNVAINEDVHMTGTYNGGNGECVGTISGNKN